MTGCHWIEAIVTRSFVTRGVLLRQLFLILLSVGLLTGCPTPTPEPEARFPTGFVDAVLDVEPEAAAVTIKETWPGAEEVPGAFQRYEIEGSEVLEEVILFRNVRHGRIDSVILKYRADLSPLDREAALTQAGHRELAAASKVQEVAWRRGMKLRVTPADRFGRLTLTVAP